MATQGITDQKILSRFVDVTLVTNGMEYRVGSGSQHVGASGKQVAVIALKRSGGYEIVLQLENGKLESFTPTQLFPIIAAQGGKGEME